MSLLVIAVIGMVAAPYVLGPLLVKSTVWFGARPAIVQLTEPPPEVRAAIAANEPALRAAGFAPEVCFEIRDMSPNQVMACAMYLHPEGHGAMIATLFVGGVARASHVELSTEHSDRWVTTGNTKQAPFGPRTEEVLLVRAPWMDAAEVCALHRTACRLARGAIVPMTSGQAAVEKTIGRYVALLHEHGYAVPERDGRYRLTWKGALLGAYQALPPGSLLVRRRAERLARAIVAGERPPA